MKKYILLLLICYASTHLQGEYAMDYYKNKRVLVTGGCGFIGSHLARALVSYGAHVTILDDLSTGFIHNIADIYDNITFIEGSITDLATCKKAAVNATHIFHCAAFISVAQSIEHPDLCHHINVDGTFNMLEAARNTQCKRFVFSSSAAVYGMPQGICSEDTQCNPLSPYGFSKLIGEYLCKQFSCTYNLETVMLRYFNVYGPGQNPQGDYAAVRAKFTDLVKQNKPITIFGDGLQSRDFIHVQEVVQANLMVGMLPASMVMGSQFNVATGKSITLLELVDQLKHEYPTYNCPITFAPARIGDIKESAADCSRFKSLYQTLL